MAQAQHPNMGVQAPGMVQQMHPGVSAAGPQVSQPGPMMGGMPPGATTGPGGPVANAHALQHLNPAQAHILQQQQYGMNTPNGNQMLQQQMARQRLLQQQQLAQQQHHGGIPVSLPAGTQGMNQAQLSALQNSNMRGPANMMHFQQQMQHVPQNIQQQQQYMAMQQAAQAAHAAAQAQAAAQANNQQGQQTPQQRAAVPPQSVTPQPQPGPQPPQGSGTPSQQSNPPQHATPQPPSQQGSQPPPQPTPNPQHQQIPQAQQVPQPPQQQAQPTPQQQQPPQTTQPQAPNGQQAVQQQPQQQVQINQGQQQHPMSAPDQLKMQQQIMMEQQRRAASMNPILQNNKGPLTHYVNSYFETLSNFQSNGEDADLLFWQEVVNKYYNTTFQTTTGQPWGVLRQGVFSARSGSKSFEVNATILPRYYVTLFNNGIRKIQTHMEATQEFTPQNGYRVVYSPKASFIYWFTNDCQLFVNGSLKVLVNPEFKFDLVDITVSGFREYIPRHLVQLQEVNEQKQSPRVTKASNKRGQQKQLPTQPTITPPESLVNEYGLPASVQCFLEIAEPMSFMTSLILHSSGNPQKNAGDVLREVTSMMAQQSMNFQAQAGQRTPSINGPSQFASPLVGQMGLPGAQASPHLGHSAQPSPAQTHLMAPGVMAHQNQPGMAANGTQGSSANTSPSVSNKRRRASTVKTEGDDGAEVNGTGAAGTSKVKASPRGGKRQKGTS
ncbi:Adhesion defective protein 1 [Talaromyces islandicus]|uniref:Adhesion defective protein 1 n=1 Tax=Talaromyces islandicus TaxID=28573 RepID=A0A0U1M1N8_TALIS|nr:Adhesion defective protein 1 [Talaromyces islandicus]